MTTPELTAKDRLRKTALAARAAGGDQAALDRALSQALAEWRGAPLAGYWPIRGEADPRPAMAAHDGPVLLPVAVGPDRPLTFRLWRGEDLDPGPMGTRHPPATCPTARPRVLIVPLAGFDAAGHRIGYGGGFYDRTLQALRRDGPVLAIGLAYRVQALPLIPAGPHDERLDAIVTEDGILTPAHENPAA